MSEAVDRETILPIRGAKCAAPAPRANGAGLPRACEAPVRNLSVASLPDVADGKPAVFVFCYGICEREECQDWTLRDAYFKHQRINTLWESPSEIAADFDPDLKEERDETPGLRHVCHAVACGNMEDCKKCTGCKAVVYCCKEHQKEDWKVRHKAVCRPI